MAVSLSTTTPSWIKPLKALDTIVLMGTTALGTVSEVAVAENLSPLRSDMVCLSHKVLKEGKKPAPKTDPACIEARRVAKNAAQQVRQAEQQLKEQQAREDSAIKSVETTKKVIDDTIACGCGERALRTAQSNYENAQKRALEAAKKTINLQNKLSALQTALNSAVAAKEAICGK